MTCRSASYHGAFEGLSCVKGNFHAQFLGGERRQRCSPTRTAQATLVEEN
jgi:hypothetical protein